MVRRSLDSIQLQVDRCGNPEQPRSHYRRCVFILIRLRCC